jgi:hypothetical protein
VQGLPLRQDPEELARDPQGLIYLQYGFHTYPFATAGTFTHVYINKRVRGARPVATDPLDPTYVREQYEHLGTVVRSMKQTAWLDKIEDVPANRSACRKYGGCPYEPVCPRAGQSLATKSLFDDFPTESTMPSTPDQQPLDVKAALNARKVRATGINPPDAARPQPVEPWTPPGSALEVMGIKVVVDPTMAPGEMELRQPQSPSTSSSRLVDAVTPSGQVVEVKYNPGHVQQVVDALSEVMRNGTADERISVARAAGSFMDYGNGQPTLGQTYLYVDCIPSARIDVVRLTDEIEERTPLILDQCRKQDPGSVPPGANDVRQVRFGQGVAALCSSFKTDPPTGNVLASSNGLQAQVIEVLEPLAALVVRGSR